MRDLDDTVDAPEAPATTSIEHYTGVVHNPWRRLREFTDARIGLGRTGISLPTNELLAFQLAHARAKDAVHMPLNITSLCEQIQGIDGLPASAPYQLSSQASDRAAYLQRPDLGRQLDQASLAKLPSAATTGHHGRQLAVVIVDGLSAHAVQQNAAPFLQALCIELAADTQTGWQINSLCIVEQGRVAIADEIGERLGADAVLVLVGERPGLSSPDSLGLYLTWGPRKGLNDAARNCISNIRPAGQSYTEAAQRTLYLLQEARRLGLSGVKLKDRSESQVIEHQHHKNSNFLTN
ncbi:ethanolamine ammonia-lyase subunit EutC [Halopseudomonas pelagia]|uniref:Ethanolamine ammonia-lyase small subunit n=1 Tax=Halopseudomonas pelagia TaxID=553151 RepID=A0AA92IIR1_9GAMM|nr:ethanolamine ammonia-lyase subunit EutC [Halopseudomonas pelagia]PCD01174.1 ethanolamine ammonia-lyase [Halopseudomonas pelagia]QFY57080.1 ethanolamine ammonia-lyase subunit EutC [Halopseudomonas pelagia]